MSLDTRTPDLVAHNPSRTGSTDVGRGGVPGWVYVAGALFSVAWGGNQFTPLLTMYKDIDGLSTGAVDMLLGAYVLGIMPALLIGGPASDRYGRRPLMLPAPLAAMSASLLLAVGAHSPALLFVSRIFSGVALGLVMVVGGSWIKELSEPPFDVADRTAGARRASISMTAGFALGAGVAALLAQFGPWAAQLPYVAHIVLTAVSFLALLRAPESRGRCAQPARLADDLKIPAAKHRRFLFVVVPIAPWVFGCAGGAYAVLPSVVSSRTHGLNVAFSGVLCLIALGVGIGVQSFAKRLDDVHSARAIVVALAATVPGLAMAAWAASTLNPWIASCAAAVLGASYGMLLVSGLQEVQRIAGPDDLAGLTAVYYSLTYLGFFIPAALAGLSAWVSYQVLFAGGIIVAVASLGLIASFYRKHLPAALPL